MKTRLSNNIFCGGLAAASLWVFVFCAVSFGGSEPLVPKAIDKGIAVNFSKILEARHFSRHTIDEEISRQAFDLYIKAIDPRKIYFMQSDVDEFTRNYRDDFALLIKKGKLDPAFDIYNRYIQCVTERCALAEQILSEPLDFTVDEEIVRDRDLLTFPKTKKEMADRWRQRIKFEYLSLEADKKDADKKAEIAQKEGTAISEAEDKWSDEAPLERLKRRYHSLQKRLEQTTNDSVLETTLTAIAGVYDPHTTYMSPKTCENFNIQMSLNFEGIGATLSWEDGYTEVKEIVKGSPAEKQGELQVGDRIIGVGQGETGPIEDVVDVHLDEVVGKIRGKGGSLVRLQVIPGNRIITIKRAKIELEDSAAKEKVFEVGEKAPGVPYKVGVIDLPSFYGDSEAMMRHDANARSTVTDVKRILEGFVDDGVDACVLDLRINGGGLLPEAIALTGLFIETGNVVQAKPDLYNRKAGQDSTLFHNDPDPGIAWGGPLVVVTSKLSASASEILAGAIKDYRRGLIVGDDTTHGKGSVQSVQPIADLLFGPLRAKPNMGAIKLTIQGFWLPGGDSSQLKGIPSDIVIPSVTQYMEGISESDLDNPLQLEKIQPATNMPHFDYVTPEMTAALAKMSKIRTDASPEFDKVREKVAFYKEIKAKKTTSLNREKYFAELEKLNSDKEEEEKIEKMMKNSSEIQKDYYLDEVLAITADYLGLLRANQVRF
ncbi:MAG: carboxy terminal-processing peptidase [Thermoguttaceae bacterium]|jgi:carboxyl-terminal processing protease